MARDSSGGKNEPQYAGTGAPADAADLSEVAAYAAFTGNHKIGPTTGTATGPGGMNTGRTTSTGADVWDGLTWEDTTDGFTYKYKAGTGWVNMAGDTGWITLSYAPNWSDFNAGYPALAYRKKNGFTVLSAMTKTSGPATVGVLICTLPAGFRIGRQEVRSTIGSGGACSVEIFPDGSVKTGPNGAYATWTSLDGISWIAEN